MITNIEPRFDPFVDSRNDVPEIADVWATPGISFAILVIFCMTSSVRCTEAESGSCTLTSK